MKRSKRILALLLSMVLLFGMLPMSALAAENEGEEELKRYTVLVLDTSSTATFLHDGEPIYTVYGDNVFEKDGIRRDRTGDGEKTRCLCGKRGIFNRDGPAMGPQIIRQLE